MFLRIKWNKLHKLWHIFIILYRCHYKSYTFYNFSTFFFLFLFHVATLVCWQDQVHKKHIFLYIYIFYFAMGNGIWRIFSYWNKANLTFTTSLLLSFLDVSLTCVFGFLWKPYNVNNTLSSYSEPWQKYKEQYLGAKVYFRRINYMYTMENELRL